MLPLFLCYGLSHFEETQNSDGEKNLEKIIEEAIEKANDAILSIQREKGQVLKSTLAMLLVTPLNIVLANVGDSRVYMLRQGEITEYTADHSVAYKKYKAGEITREEIGFDEDQSALFRTFGSDDGNCEVAERNVGKYVEDAIMKKKKIIAISVVVVLIAAFVVWFEIPRVRIRNYIKENLPEGHYTLYPNYGDYIISDSTRDQATDRIWHAYDKDRNVHFNIFQIERECVINTRNKRLNDEIYIKDNYRSNFMERYWSSLTYDKENECETKLNVIFIPDDRGGSFEWSSVYNIGGAFADRKELDALFDDLYVAAKFYEEKNVPASYGVFDFQYTNYKEFKNVNSGLFRIGGTLEDIEAERTEAYYRMIDIGMEYNDEEILSQFTQEEMDGYVPYLERIK